MIYIIADDLTGANDTGVQFARQGYNTQVAIMSAEHCCNLPDDVTLRDVDVFVIDTETRDADAETARKHIRHVLENLKPAQHDLVYKKIDSTLRGNIAIELDECLHLLHKDLCILTPSFPPAKRITVGGYLIVHDQPLGLSEYYNGNLNPEDASFIPSLLQSDTTFPIMRIDLHDVITGQEAILEKIRNASANGKKIVVIDAINAEQLRTILLSSFAFEGSVLYSGSAGLANALSEIYDGNQHLRNKPDITQAPALIVVGTRRTIARQQINYLKKTLPIAEIHVDIAQILAKRTYTFEKYIATITQAICSGRDALIEPKIFPPSARQDALKESSSQELINRECQRLLVDYQMKFRALELAIRQYVGDLVAAIVKKTFVRNLIVTGGDTAVGVCSALQIYHLTIVDELLPGIPFAVGRLENDMMVNIVTKAGGFGDEKTLYTLLEQLEHYPLTSQRKKWR